MSEPEHDYHAALQMLEDSYREGIRAFARYVAKHWTMTPDDWRKMTAEECPSDDWFAGRNEGVRSVLDVVDHFLGDFHP